MAPSRGDLASAAEASVVALAATGDDKAFRELVRRRQGMVRGLLRRFSGDAALADDLAQEAFLLMWRNLSRLESPAAFGGWMKRIVVTTWLQHARKARLPMEAIEEAGGVAAPAEGDTADRLDLDRALTTLKPAERLCVVLCYNEGMSHAEIAQSTGLPLGTVKSHVTRGAERLRRALGGTEAA
jgi:RNA polymerase sigma-70 factor (ECF subfamily)